MPARSGQLGVPSLHASGEADDGYARIAPEHVVSIDDWQVRELVEKVQMARMLLGVGGGSTDFNLGMT